MLLSIQGDGGSSGREGQRFYAQQAPQAMPLSLPPSAALAGPLLHRIFGANIAVGGSSGATASRGDEFGVGSHDGALFSLPSQAIDGSIDLKFSGLRLLEVDEDLLLSRAKHDYEAKNYIMALEHCNAIYSQNPRKVDNLMLLGSIYYQLGEFDLCIVKTEEAIRISPHSSECYCNIANALMGKGNIDQAIIYYLRAIELQCGLWEAWANLANAYMRKGRLSEALQCCRQTLLINPQHVGAYNNLGSVMKAQGLLRDAYNCYVQAISIEPTSAISWSNLAGLFMQTGDANRAIQYYKEAIKHDSAHIDAHLNLGNLYKALGMQREAIAYYQNVLQAYPGNVLTYVNLGNAYYEHGQLDLAIVNYRKAISHDSSNVEAYNNLGNALKAIGRVDEAINCYQSCLSLQPNHPQALTNIGNIYMEKNMTSIAASFYMASISVTTGLSAPFSNLATIYKQQGNYSSAIACYSEVLRINPLAADGLVNRGNIFKEIGKISEAIQDYMQAVTVRPTMAEAHANLASAYKDTGHVDAAIKCYKLALQLRADFPEATCNLLHTLQCVCDWDDRDKKFAEVEGLIRQQIQMSLVPSVQPFHAIAYPIDPILALEISEKYAAHYSLVASRFGLPAFVHPPPTKISNNNMSSRLRVGYVSSDFGNHPLSHLMGSVFGLHRHGNVEVFCYALSQNDGSEWRQRIQSETEHFIDVSSMSSDIIARTINEDKIHILVNLNGYTKGARNEIFAMQPAPIQISYMGFPGTTGAKYIDYLVTDEFVSPTCFAHIYSEKLVHLPHSYFVNDYKQKNRDVLEPIGREKRLDYGLPLDKFIFACFNQLYKMDPDIFNTWCNILKRVPNSALWLLRFPAAGEARLRAYAISKGVRPDQIIFTDVAAKPEHIRRSALADLFLDTPLCNGHTTGTDILWAGLPMITLPLEKMATRVAGSLCLATGVGEEMIVRSLKEYEEKAVDLAENPSKLQALTNKLKAARLTCPLFDTVRWVRNLERAYYKMWSLHCLGMRPKHFKVLEDDEMFPSDRSM